MVALIIVGIIVLVTDPAIGTPSTASRSSAGSTSAASASTMTASSPTDFNATQQVSLQVTHFLSDLRNRNVSALKQYYTNDSVVVLTGCTDGLGGRYSGSSSIEGLYAQYENGIASFSFNSSSVALNLIAPSTVNATYALAMTTSGFFGTINASVAVQQQWVFSGDGAQPVSGGWTVGQETWDFLSLNVHSSIIHVPAC